MTTNLLPGIPLIESPLFDALKPSLALTPDEARIADDLAAKGYATLTFPDDDFGARAERIKDRLAPRYGPNFADAAADKTVGERRVQDAWQFDSDVAAIANNPSIIALLTKLYGRQAFAFQTLNFSVGTEQAAHTDIVHFSSLPERFMCGVWVALEDITPDNGPLRYYPGSHRWPILSNALVGRRGFGSSLSSAQDPFEPIWAALCDVHGAQEDCFYAKKGEALIWTANLLHGGSPQNDRTATRWSQVTHYYFDDCIYYTPAFSDEAIGQLHLRDIVSVDGHHHGNQYLGERLSGEVAKPGLLRRLSRALR